MVEIIRWENEFMNDIAIDLLRINDAYLLGSLSGNAFHHLLV